ncbi:MAG: phosphatidylserine/phosphatidylglycerophosphate/cardiolipin synthase family protein [Chlamydiia bacterium]|nr:phosphatidylserine/phosphatidylglycerophosphate/cardiolipin synthase family protein [Chlamydiia bacterium]
MKKTLIALLLAVSMLSTQVCAREQNQLIKLYHSSEPDKRLLATFESAIKNAQESILILTFTFSDHDLIRLINEKAEAGVDVTVVINADHSGTLLRHRNPKVKMLTRPPGDGRIHHKILVVDDRSVWLGSANFSSTAFTDQENLVAGFESKQLACAIRDEARVFEGIRKRDGGFIFSEMLNNQEISLYLLPHVNPNRKNPEEMLNKSGKDCLLAIINNAKSHIRIAMMAWTDTDLASAILEAHRRGVTVEVLMQSYMDPVPMQLKAAGITVKAHRHSSLMHSKWMWVDGHTLVNGSANWSRSSFSRNDESFVVIKNLSQEQQRFMEDYWTYLVN